MKASERIRFGTSGWRAILADQFTFSNVGLATCAIARRLKSSGQGQKGLVLAGDFRFLTEELIRAAIEVLAAHGIVSYVCPLGTPTPTVSWEVIRRKAAASINFTASHNPAVYQGLKFNGPDGGPASAEITRGFEEEIDRIGTQEIPRIPYAQACVRHIVPVDPRPRYFEKLRGLVRTDRLKGLRVLYDPLYGNGRGYLDRLLSECGAMVKTIHDWRDPLFGGHDPSPGVTELEEASHAIRAGDFDIGLSTDGDADRFGVIDRDGSFVPPNEVLPVLLEHLIHTRGAKGCVVRSVATTRLLDEIAREHGVRLHETPVGFKYIAEIMHREPVLLGCEESGGLTVFGHVPEKDGILACLLAAEVVAETGRSIRENLAAIHERLGEFHSDRIDLELPGDRTEQLKALLEQHHALGAELIAEPASKDGMRFVSPDGDWILIRFSGTEPVARCYLEARSAERLERLRQTARELLGSPDLARSA